MVGNFSSIGGIMNVFRASGLSEIQFKNIKDIKEFEDN